jgi:iron donor protein CyaY
MENTEYTQLAETILQNIYDAIEAADTSYLLDYDLLDGILNIETRDGGEYIINKHNASQQIWVSSPISGACRFSYHHENQTWIGPHGENLLEVLKSDLRKSVGIEISV